MLDKENVVKIEFTKYIGDHAFEVVVLFNKRRISEDEVNDIIKTGSYHPQVIVMDKPQFMNVFVADDTTNQTKECSDDDETN